ncbi:hypothetical protein BDW60DRAFT_148549 [Aspergillus nidulans var. acristatus]
MVRVWIIAGSRSNQQNQVYHGGARPAQRPCRTSTEPVGSQNQDQPQPNPLVPGNGRMVPLGSSGVVWRKFWRMRMDPLTIRCRVPLEPGGQLDSKFASILEPHLVTTERN